MRDRLDGLWDDEDFAGWYPRDGRPGLSPAQLATVCVLQFVLGLSHRQAAEAVRCRNDFKYALAMALDDPGFHHSVLADFRERLTRDGRADRLLDLVLARRKEAGLVRERTTQRTDSTHVLAAVRDLTRLEPVTEAVRAALEEAARTAGHPLVGPVDEDWGRRHGRPVRLGKNPTRPKTRILAASDDACRLLERLHQHGSGYRPGPQAEALRQIVAQNYYRDAAGRLRRRTPTTAGCRPPPRQLQPLRRGCCLRETATSCPTPPALASMPSGSGSLGAVDGALPVDAVRALGLGIAIAPGTGVPLSVYAGDRDLHVDAGALRVGSASAAGSSVVEPCAAIGGGHRGGHSDNSGSGSGDGCGRRGRRGNEEAGGEASRGGPESKQRACFHVRSFLLGSHTHCSPSVV
ncbi:transposase [Streptomyces sp. NPDC055966]|uniref:transposase n=1 Tax=Streptomyces sp. NPDC055966 TaxID=3345669 RepID=UPI0035E280CF